MNVAHPDDDRRPIPDPTKLTTDAVNQATQNARRELEAFQKVIDERLESVHREFALIERQRIENKADANAALNAALSAAKEAVTKTEANTTTQLTQISDTISKVEEGLRRASEDQKERINKIENRLTSVEQQKVGANENRSGLYAAIGISVTVLLAALTVLGFILTTAKP